MNSQPSDDEIAQRYDKVWVETKQLYDKKYGFKKFGATEAYTYVWAEKLENNYIGLQYDSLWMMKLCKSLYYNIMNNDHRPIQLAETLDS